MNDFISDPKEKSHLTKRNTLQNNEDLNYMKSQRGTNMNVDEIK